MPGCLAQGIANRDMVVYRFGDGAGEEPAGQIVPAFGRLTASSRAERP